MKTNVVALEKQKEAYDLYNRAYNNSYDTENKDWEILNATREFHNKYYNDKPSDFKNAKHWFYRDDKHPDRVHPNKIAVSLVDDVLIPRCRYILERMKETGNGQEFLKRQLSWFGETYDEIGYVAFQSIKSAKEEFTEFVAGLQGKSIPRSEQEAFGIIFFNKHSRAYGLRTKKGGYKGNDHPTRTNSYAKNIINEIFDVRGIALVIETNEDGWVVKDK